MLLRRFSNVSYGRRFRTAIVCLVVIVACAFFSHASALTLSPARIEISGDPGSIIGGEFTVINEQSTPQTFYASYENFSAQGETGTPTFSSDKTGLDTWISVAPSQITIAPGQALKVPYTITIPKDADPGGYFAAIFWSSAPPVTANSQVSIGAKIGLLVLLRVNGQIAESAGITQFNRDGHGFFYTMLPVDFQYTFRNDGGDRVEPVGAVTLRDTFFIKSASLDANASEGNILPSSVRQFTVEWLMHAAPLPLEGFFNTVDYQWQNFAVGIYSAHLDLAYGTTNMHATKTLWFFVFPWQLIGCLLILFLIVWRGGKALLSRYNRYIVKQALGR